MVTRRKKVDERVQNPRDYPSKTCIHNQRPLPRWWKVSKAIRKKCYNIPHEAQRASDGLCVKWVW